MPEKYEVPKYEITPGYKEEEYKPSTEYKKEEYKPKEEEYKPSTEYKRTGEGSLEKTPHPVLLHPFSCSTTSEGKQLPFLATTGTCCAGSLMECQSWRTEAKEEEYKPSTESKKVRL